MSTCKSRTSKGGLCKRKVTNSNYCKIHSKRILDEIKKAQLVSEEKSRYARELYSKYMEGKV